MTSSYYFKIRKLGIHLDVYIQGDSIFLLPDCPIIHLEPVSKRWHRLLAANTFLPATF